MTKIDYSTQIQTLRGEDKDLGEYKGKVLLIVNTASKCGLTPQYKGLEKLHQEFTNEGLVILGFPCNQFGKQEPGSSEDIESFCQINYGVSFPMHSKIEVNGKKTHDLYVQLKKARPGLMGSKSIKWNFTKFLVGQDGTIIARFGPKTAPRDLVDDIKKALK